MITITFYSFKGGVGRTMAMANVAHQMAQNGKRVFMMDFDLEAPGLTLMKEFYPDEESVKRRRRGGLFRYMKHFCIQGLPADISEYIVYPKGKDAPFYFLPAGDVEKGYNLDEIDFNYLCKEIDGETFFDKMKKKIEALGADYLLIDARTGISEYWGVCLKMLPDAVTLLFSLNRQNIIGTKWALGQVKPEIIEDKKVLLVATPLPLGEDTLKQERINKAVSSFNGKKIDVVLPYSSRLSLIEDPFIAMESGLAETPLSISYKNLYWKVLGLNTYDFDILLNKGKKELERKEYEEAKKTFENMLKHHPEKKESHFLLGYTLSFINKSEDEAIANLKKALEMKPDDPEITIMIANILASVNNNEEAEIFYKKALEVEPNKPEFLNYYATLLGKMKRSTEAEDCYKKAIELKPYNVEYRKNYANLLSEVERNEEADGLIKEKTNNIILSVLDYISDYAGLLEENKRYDEAEECYKIIIELNPHDPIALNNYAGLLYMLERYNEAEQYSKKAIDIEPDNPIYLNSYSRLLNKMKDYVEAEKYSRKAVEIEPDNPVFLSDYAGLLYFMGQYVKAEEFFRRAIKIEPNNQVFQRNYANLLHKMERYEEAAEHYKKAVD